MKKLEDDKPSDGWGFAKNSGTEGGDQQEDFDKYKNNLQKAMQ